MPAPDDTSQRLVEAAGPIFAEKGYQATTVREICQAAGANIAAVNYYFRDKERLYIEVVKNACMERVEGSPLPQWPEGTPAEVKLRDFIRVVVQRILGRERPSWHTRLVLREMAEPTAACTVWVQDQIRPMFEVLQRILRELRPDESETQRHLIAFSIVGQCVYHRVFVPVVTALVGPEEQSGYTPEVLIDHVTQFTLSALGLDNGPRSRTSHAKVSS
jgi:AcrR family transcriptional regulator